LKADGIVKEREVGEITQTPSTNMLMKMPFQKFRAFFGGQSCQGARQCFVCW